MYLDIYWFTCTYIYNYIYIHTYIYIYTPITSIHIYTHVHTHTHPHMHTGASSCSAGGCAWEVRPRVTIPPPSLGYPYPRTHTPHSPGAKHLNTSAWLKLTSRSSRYSNSGTSNPATWYVGTSYKSYIICCLLYVEHDVVALGVSSFKIWQSWHFREIFLLLVLGRG